MDNVYKQTGSETYFRAFNKAGSQLLAFREILNGQYGWSVGKERNGKRIGLAFFETRREAEAYASNMIGTAGYRLDLRLEPEHPPGLTEVIGHPKAMAMYLQIEDCLASYDGRDRYSELIDGLVEEIYELTGSELRF